MFPQFIMVQIVDYQNKAHSAVANGCLLVYDYFILKHNLTPEQFRNETINISVFIPVMFINATIGCDLKTKINLKQFFINQKARLVGEEYENILKIFPQGTSIVRVHKAQLDFLYFNDALKEFLKVVFRSPRTD
jgi:hypothetical protein